MPSNPPRFLAPSTAMTDQPPSLWLTGYQDRSAVDIVQMADCFEATAVVDVCDLSDNPAHMMDRSQRLRELLNAANISFHHAGRQLGVVPTASNHSTHTGLEFSMRGFADHMRTDVFTTGIKQLVSLAKRNRIIVINGDSDFEMTSRTLIADYLFLIEGFKVYHILPGDGVQQHSPTPAARVELDGIVYDRAQTDQKFYH